MMQGLWTAEFGSGLGMLGAGIMVFQDGGRLVGGDAGYFYLGQYKIDGTVFCATIKASPFSLGSMSVFKAMGPESTLELRGSLSSDGQFIAQAHPVGKPHLRIEVKLTKRE